MSDYRRIHIGELLSIPALHPIANRLPDIPSDHHTVAMSDFTWCVIQHHLDTLQRYATAGSLAGIPIIIHDKIPANVVRIAFSDHTYDIIISP